MSKRYQKHQKQEWLLNLIEVSGVIQNYSKEAISSCCHSMVGTTNCYQLCKSLETSEKYSHILKWSTQILVHWNRFVEAMKYILIYTKGINHMSLDIKKPLPHNWLHLQVFLYLTLFLMIPRAVVHQQMSMLLAEKKR